MSQFRSIESKATEGDQLYYVVLIPEEMLKSDVAGEVKYYTVSNEGYPTLVSSEASIKGRQYLKSKPNGVPSDNLSNLPMVTVTELRNFLRWTKTVRKLARMFMRK